MLVVLVAAGIGLAWGALVSRSRGRDVGVGGVAVAGGVQSDGLFVSAEQEKKGRNVDTLKHRLGQTTVLDGQRCPQTPNARHTTDMVGNLNATSLACVPRRGRCPDVWEPEDHRLSDTHNTDSRTYRTSRRGKTLSTLQTSTSARGASVTVRWDTGGGRVDDVHAALDH